MKKDKFLTVMGKKVLFIEEELADKNLGQFRSEPCLTIQIKPGLKKGQRQRVIFHEMLHCALWISGSGYCMNVDQEEGVVLMLETFTEDLLKGSKRV